MSAWKKLAAAPAATGGPLNIEDVFSTYLYEGNGSSQTITNGIDLSGEGGMVWCKSRTTARYPTIVDTERGASGGGIFTAATLAADTNTGYISQFNSDGFQVGSFAATNENAQDFASWTFRKAPKFFDVVTYSGNGSNQTISHNLGSVPGMVIIKSTSQINPGWSVWHRNLTNYTYSLILNSTGAQSQSYIFQTQDPDANNLYLNNFLSTNGSGYDFVAYLFAHNDGDGEFGPTGDQDIIKCGSMTGTGSVMDINLGFEPQWIMFKRTDAAGSWEIFDNMRGMVPAGTNSSSGKRLEPNATDVEGTTSPFQGVPTPTGFRNESTFHYASGRKFIYVAIRRGPMAVPESGTDVFAIDEAGTGTMPPRFHSDFPVDFAFYREINFTSAWSTGSRLNDAYEFFLNLHNAESSSSQNTFDFQNGWNNSSNAGTDSYSWMWRRAPNYFDVVSYEGTGSNQTINHNLGVTPEMMWVKARSRNAQWIFYHSGIGNTGAMWINDIGDGVITDSTYWNNTSPSSTSFSLGSNYRVNQSGNNYIAYLFSSLDGVSKVGTYTGDGTDGRTIDCGFSSGARFVLIKDTAANLPFQVYDSARGITSGNTPFLQLNSSSGQNTSFDLLDPDNSGFKVNSTINYVNQSGKTYLFYAIA